MKHNISFLFFLVIAINAVAQRKKEIFVTKYTQINGLPSYNVRKVFQDSKGFIWIGTQDGVSRFDGRYFVNYSKSASVKHKICGVDVREIIEDSISHLLWVLPAEIGINAIDPITGQVVLTAPIPHAHSEDWNICMIKDGDLLLIGTSTGIKQYSISRNTYKEDLPLPPTKLLKDFETRSIVKDEYGNIWACYSRYGIIIYDGKTKKIIQKISLSQLNDHAKSNEIRFNSYIITKPGEIIFATSQGLRKINYFKGGTTIIDNNPCKTAKALNSESIETISLKNQKELFVSGYGRFYKFDLDLQNYSIQQEPTKLSETDWLNAVQYIFTDKENNTWLGCQEGLAFIPHKVSPFSLYNYDKLTNTKLEQVRSIYPLNNGTILVGLRNGIVSIDSFTKRYTQYDTGHLYHHIFQDKKGLIHVSRAEGMFIFSNGSFFPVFKFYTELKPYSFCPINSHLFINDTLIILGTENDNGILLWNPLAKKVRQLGFEDSASLLGSNIVNNIYKDSKGNVWVLSDNVISILSPDLKTSKHIIPIEKTTGIVYKLFFDICEASNHYWITSYGAGLIELDTALQVAQTFNTENGLSNDGTYQVFNIDKKYLLVTTNNGLNLVYLSNLKIKPYFEKDGLHSNAFEEVAGVMKDGVTYAGGLHGFTKINSNFFSKNDTPPILYFTDIKTEIKSGLIDTSNLFINEIEISNKWLQTNISFIGLNYSNPDRVTYTYRIKERNQKWSDLGNQNFITLIGLNPGTYHLEVKAFNEDGIPSEIKELTLIFLPKWYQTWWFKLVLSIAFIAAIYGLYRIRINHLKKQQAIRTKLASDLHDDLGSTLNSIKVFANLALMDGDKDKYAYKIKEAVQGAITGVKDMIWVLDDSKDTVEHLVGRVRQFASSLCEANVIHYHEDISDEIRDHKFTQGEKRNLYMILKEAINNACKYSNAKEVTIVFSLHKKKPLILVKDNGTGFDNSIVSDGNGLKNMKFRAKEIRYLLTIDTAPGNGTLIRLQKI